MAPVIILIRHAEAVHNLTDKDIPDPSLTAKGLEQCKELATDLQSKLFFAPQDCLIVSSPLRRTLQTVQHSLGWLREQGVPLKARAEWQETSGLPCDVGTAPSEAALEWPDLDLLSLDPIYPQKRGLYEASEEAYQTRARFAKQWLSERPEKCIIVMSHAGFLRRAVGGPRFLNTEYRIYGLVENGSPPTPDLEQQPLGILGNLPADEIGWETCSDSGEE